MVTDTIADLIVQIKNASAVRKESIEVPYSKFKHSIATKLNRMALTGDIAEKGKGVTKRLVITLKYDKNGAPVAKNFRRISKPSCRIYMRVNEILPIKQGYGEVVLSTPKGVLTGGEARKAQVGGEVLFSVW